MDATHPRLCAIVPVYDARATLPAVLDGVARWGIPIIVVDDGSTDGTREWLRAWSGESDADGAAGAGRTAGMSAPSSAPRFVIERERNGGKAEALKDGFARAIELGFHAAVTIDADGQHDPSDGPRLIERFCAEGGRSIVCGRRSAATPGYPLRNLAGRRMNDLGIRAETGERVCDSPCGLRVYPLEVTRRVRCLSGRFAWEEEFLTRALWAGCGYESVEIRCIYRVEGGRRSHYKFLRDWPEAIAVNVWLLARALAPPGLSPRSWRAFVEDVIGALAPQRVLDHLAGDSPGRLHGAAAMALGAAGAGWWGMLPPAWSIACAAIATWIVIRLHGSLVLAASAGACAWGAGAVSSSAAAPLGVLLMALLVPATLALRRRAE